MSIPWLAYKYNCINNLPEINRPNLRSAQRCDFWGKAAGVLTSQMSPLGLSQWDESLESLTTCNNHLGVVLPGAYVPRSATG